MFKFYF